MMQVDDREIASRSYFIWEREGKPEGKALEHWLRAKVELEAETASPTNGSKPKARRAKTTTSSSAAARAKKTKAVRAA